MPQTATSELHTQYNINIHLFTTGERFYLLQESKRRLNKSVIGTLVQKKRKSIVLPHQSLMTMSTD